MNTCTVIGYPRPACDRLESGFGSSGTNARGTSSASGGGHTTYVSNSHTPALSVQHDLPKEIDALGWMLADPQKLGRPVSEALHKGGWAGTDAALDEVAAHLPTWLRTRRGEMFQAERGGAWEPTAWSRPQRRRNGRAIWVRTSRGVVPETVGA